MQSFPREASHLYPGTMDSSSEVSKQNICSDTKQNRVMTEEDWKQKWENKRIAHHQVKIHKLLSEFLDTMLNNRKELRIFFPLCGKAVDMKWLADMGHNIVGADVSETAIKGFFEEQNISHVEEAVPGIPGAKVFKSTSGNLSLYCCSIYDISDVCVISSSIVAKFDGIWDRGGLVAVNPCDRERYIKVILSLMDKDCRYLLVLVAYDPKLVRGPPFYVTDADLETLFGSLCNIKCLKTVDSLTHVQEGWGLDFFQEKIYLLTLKSSS
ncbi:thiopurine S-methyltransferase-like isoform X2 [Ascaphus truei]|uniref:thiopurine S-methyltransferase-like isoform X2 n=1 Tax=Ascaphus truei TaxID=8439 RepID=UPI003F5A65BA